MSTLTLTIPSQQLKKIGINKPCIHYQHSAEELTEQTLQRHEGVLNDTDALCVLTGQFTGRCPKDKFVVADNETKVNIDWNSFNLPIDEKYFFLLQEKLSEFLNKKNEVWVRDCYACADTDFRISIRVINENPWSNLFASNMFIRPNEDELGAFKPEWHII